MASGIFDYNIAWMDRTFRTHKQTETLLVPELENGNLSRRDYDALMATLPGFPYTSLTGLLFGVGSLWNAHYRLKAMSGMAYFCGDVVGRGLRLYSHRRYFRSIENIDGFARAMANVQDKVGYDNTGFINLSRPLSFSHGQHASFQPEADTPYGGSLDSSTTAPVVPVVPAPKIPVAKSRWEELRAARTDGPSKAWENIRQGRKPDGTALSKPSAPESDSGQSWTNETFRDSDRAAEQARFDAMLERERRQTSS
ncbi:hypothetical protein B0H15DRAFT_202514 [Mycena belliarum]|uniref:Uncharacterized protein n=1 Tax=Mycena belliarum TaxID=1033014 RepID=A0AAD6UH43_9AGAR|nr:hypothetical protein B0H15DRAFT_202514 [Mycena belliae]